MGGVAAYPIDGNHENELFCKADGALYRAKMTGRNKFVLAVEERMVHPRRRISPRSKRK